jgi:hypothetical protein
MDPIGPTLFRGWARHRSLYAGSLFATHLSGGGGSAKGITDPWGNTFAQVDQGRGSQPADLREIPMNSRNGGVGIVGAIVIVVVILFIVGVIRL